MTKGLQPGASSQPAGLTLRSFQLNAVALLDRALKDAAPSPTPVQGHSGTPLLRLPRVFRRAVGWLWQRCSGKRPTLQD